MENKDLPRICYVLGGEKTPLKIGERFGLKAEKVPSLLKPDYFIDADGVVKVYIDGKKVVVSAESVSALINGECMISRHLQFSEDEKSFMRLLVKAGFPWIARDQDGAIYIFQKKPAMVLKESDNYFCDEEDDYLIPTKLFPKITFENSPINCLDYVSESCLE